MMKLIIGLGNIGKQYEKTRHNVGFMIVDELVSRLGATWKLESKFKAEIAEGEWEDQKIMLVKPQTMMNNSGEAARAIMDFYKLTPGAISAVYDEIDLPLGEIRLRFEGGSGGHQGVNSLIRHIGAEFTRVRVGIDPNQRPAEPSEIYVLKNFSPEQLEKLPAVIQLGADTALESLNADSPIKRTI